METLTIDTARWFRALFLGAGAALIGGGIAAFAATQDEAVRWMTALVLGGTGVACVVFGISRRRRLILEPEGIFGQPFGLVQWSDVEEVFVRWNGLNRVLGLKVLEPSKYLQRLPRWRRSLWKLSRNAGFGDVSFDITGLRISSDELLANVRRRVGPAGSGARGSADVSTSNT